MKFLLINTHPYNSVLVLKECVTDPNTNADDARLTTLATTFEKSVYQHAANKVLFFLHHPPYFKSHTTSIHKNAYFADIAKKMYHLKVKSNTANRKRMFIVYSYNIL